MRSWLLSNTFYGTWLPGDERGSVTSVRDVRPEDAPSDFRFEHDVPGTPWEEGMPALRRAAEAQMKGPPIYLDVRKAEILLAQFHETAAYRGRVLRAVSIMFNHCHLVVQVADDPDFTHNVQTVFNNDMDNSSGKGIGKDREYFETQEGKLINAKGIKGRYLRLYSKGSTESALNEYTEVEVYGRPAK